MEASAARRPSHAGPRVPARLLRLASDERLVEHVRNGSEPAFEAVFDRHSRGILAFCRHMLGSAEEAEDAVQHTFMAAYRSLIGSRSAIQLRPWLYTIARNRCLSVLRARREQPVDNLDELPTENLSVEVQRRQDLRDLLLDVGGLPEDQRAALVLAEVGGVSHEEISQVLGVQREKVKALVFQARSSLIASRAARDTPCEEIRMQLAELRGGALRRNSLRRHLKVCAGCREFRGALQDQRKMLALALPVVPTLALKHGVMAGALGSGAAAASGAAVGGAAGATAGGSLLAGGGAMTAKVLAIAAIAGGGAVGVKAVRHERPGGPSRARPPGQSGGGAERGAQSGKPGGRRTARALRPRSTASSRSLRTPSRATRKRLSEQRSEGRRGSERRSERANEHAAGPEPGARQAGHRRRRAPRRARAVRAGRREARRARVAAARVRASRGSRGRCRRRARRPRRGRSRPRSRRRLRRPRPSRTPTAIATVTPAPTPPGKDKSAAKLDE